MRRALVIIALFLAAPAHAAPTQVRAVLDGDLARITARYLIAREAAGSEMTIVELPEGALVIGASVAAHRLTLVEAATAEEAYQAIENAPHAREMQWAAKVVRSGSAQVAVSIAAPHGGFAELELEIAAPSCYFRDARYVAVPETWPHTAKPPGCGAGNAWLAIPDRALIGHAGGLDRIGGDAGRLPLGDEHVARVELDIASRLGEVPRDLMTAIVIDSSRSLDDRRVLDQRKLVLAYLRLVPDTRVQIIAFARRPHALLPGWTTASQVLPRVERLLASEPLRNGTNLDEALADAASWLAELPGTHRILLVTDELLPESIAVPNLRGTLAADTLVHVAVLDGGTAALARDDTGALGVLAAATFGMRVTGAPDDPELLVRPLSIDQVHVRAPGWTELSRGDICPPDLAEGRACTWWLTGEAGTGPVTIEGLVWGRRLARTFAPDLSRAQALARELSGIGGLDEARQRLADRAAHAVNDVWSLFGSWGGRGGYDGMGSGMGMTGGGGSCACDGIGTVGHGRFGAIGHVDDHLAAQLAPMVAACHAERDSLSVTLELTLAEVVAVTVEIRSSPDELPATLRRRHDCLVDAIWDIDLAIAVPQAHQSVTVALP